MDERPSSNLFVPSTLQDFQGLLDNDLNMSETPVLGELSADNFYLKDPFWLSLNPKEKNAYIWAPDIYAGNGTVLDWNTPYQQVFIANVVLDGLKKVTITSDIHQQQWNKLKGAALFMRAYAFYNIAQVFAPVYDNATANDPNSGIPLRLTPNVDEVTSRSTVNKTYTQILSDLLEAKDLLSDSLNFSNRNRPCKPAALAMLARVYLSMRIYDKAGAYADSCLQLYKVLIDYNTINAASTRPPFDNKNEETMYQSRMLSNTSVLKSVLIKDCIVDSTLYQSYENNDLRRAIFFTSSNPPNSKSGYNGTIFLFTGLATDEMFLVRAESYARAGNRSAALNDLNTLLEKRWKTGAFVPITANTDADALDKILKERRKELPFRGLRWTDIRRLNKDDAGIIIKRRLYGRDYVLSPNSPLYVLPIPPDVIQLSGIPQNDR